MMGGGDGWIDPDDDSIVFSIASQSSSLLCDKLLSSPFEERTIYCLDLVGFVGDLDDGRGGANADLAVHVFASVQSDSSKATMLHCHTTICALRRRLLFVGCAIIEEDAATEPIPAVRKIGS